MKKIITILFLVTILSANEIDVAQQDVVDVVDLKSYNEFTTGMKRIISLGDTSKAYPLALFYLRDFPFKKHNINEAIKYFKIALESPITVTSAALYLSQLLEPAEALKYLEYSIKTESTSSKKIVILRYLEIVLTNFYKNRILLEKTYNLTSPHVYKINDPVLDFAYAHLLLLLDKTELANKFLNSACNNPNATRELLNRCFNNPNLIKVKNEKDTIINQLKSRCCGEE